MRPGQVNKEEIKTRDSAGTRKNGVGGQHIYSGMR